MTVQKLIDELNLIRNRTIRVNVYLSSYLDYYDIVSERPLGSFVLISVTKDEELDKSCEDVEEG